MQRAALSLREDPVRSNPVMRTIEEIRRLRLEELRQEVEHLGGLAEINRRRGTNPRSAQLYNIAAANKGTKTGAPMSMGSDLARAIEVAMGKPRGWMDHDPEFWPFELLDRRRFESLSERQRGAVEAAALRELSAVTPESHGPTRAAMALAAAFDRLPAGEPRDVLFLRLMDQLQSAAAGVAPAAPVESPNTPRPTAEPLRSSGMRGAKIPPRT